MGIFAIGKRHDETNKPPGRHAVVIGAGMAGLWAARVLSDHFARVTVVERDRLPESPAHRRGVPQSYHTHTLLTRGQRALDQLFPGIDAELADLGAPRVEWTRECLFYFRTGWTRPFRSELASRACSRDLLEWAIRRDLAGRAAIRFVEGREVEELLFEPQTGRVTGVQLRTWGTAATSAAVDNRDRGDGVEETLHADLVVDASGRDSVTPAWLEALGYGPVPETVITPFLGYASRLYRRPPELAPKWKALIVSNVPPHQPRGGVLYPVEDGCWIATLAGCARDYPPTDEAGFLAFARSLATPVLAEALDGAEPLSPIRGYRRTENRLRHYEQLDRWPDGFVALGDAACTFNPVYGQGMTVSALGALVLDQCLRERRRRRSGDDLRGLSRRFQRRLAWENRTPWLLATGEDFRWPTTVGGSPDFVTRLAHWYVDLVLESIVSDQHVAREFFRVLHLLESPIMLLQPQLLARILARATKQ